MEKSIERIIRRVLEEARAKGRDHLAQTELAVKVVCQARPDMTASDAQNYLAMIKLASIRIWIRHNESIA